tara:strand:+ start:1694 stop:3100 length:1407 start_codon:yes stop_codon:yes gene_type:complete
MSRFSLTYLCSFFLLLSVLSFFNIIYSYYFNLYLNVNTYIYTLLISLFIGSFFLFKKKKENKVSIYEKISVVILGYFLLPLIISIPFFLSIYNISFIDCYFEAISGFTSTGFTIFDNVKHLDQSIILWRSSSQWIGGLYFLFSIILLINVFDDKLKKSLTNFLSFNTSETFNQSFKVLILYSILTFIIFVILKLIDFRTFNAVNFSLSLISSGGFLPTNSLDKVINTDFKKIIFSILMLISFFSIFLSYNLTFIKKKNLNVFFEDFYLLLYLLIVIIIFFLFFNYNENFIDILFSISSSISNIGFSLKGTNSDQYFIFLILVIIGGSFFSTSSGIRFIKLFTLIKYSINDLLSHTKPKQILISKMAFSEKNIDQTDVNKYFFTLIVFIISLSTIVSLLLLSNIDLDNSFKLGILTIMNTVNSSNYGIENFDFLNLNYFSKLALMTFMIIGRVELLTILILAKKFLFKN